MLSGSLHRVVCPLAAAAPSAPALVPGYPQLLSLGCWGDNTNNNLRVLPHTNSNLYLSGPDPIGTCLQYALSQGDTYFGIQWGGQCFSGSDYHYYGAPYDGSLATSACATPCSSGYPYCGGNRANWVFQILPQCDLSTVLSSLPSNTLSGGCNATLMRNASCSVSCVSPYQVPTGTPYACSSSGVLSGGQVCADPVCTATQTGSEVVVPVVGGLYHGPTSASLGSYISVSASLPFPGPFLYAPNVVGSLFLDGPGAVPCAANTAVTGAASASSGQCTLAVPSTGTSFTLTATFSYQRDWCTTFVGTVSTNITLVDLAAVQATAAAALAGVNAEKARAVAAESSEASARQAGDATLTASLASESALRASMDATLNAAELAESARAMRVESSLATNATLLSARVVALETAQSSFLFRGLQTGVAVSYPTAGHGSKAPQVPTPGSGTANMLNYRIVFDAPLSSRGTGISYNVSSGVAIISEPGTYRLDAFVHLYAGSATNNGVGTGVVSWMTLDAVPVPLGANILNPSAAGVAQGTVGDDTYVSTLINVPAGASATTPFTAQCVLVSMNQQTNTITDASVIAITKLK